MRAIVKMVFVDILYTFFVGYEKFSQTVRYYYALLFVWSCFIIIGYQCYLYMRRLGKPLERLDIKYSVSLPSSESINSGQILHGCTVLVDYRELCMDFIVLDMVDYEVIPGMD